LTSRNSHLFPKLLAKPPFMVGTRPQLIVVSGLSVGIPLMVGFRPQLVVSGLSVGIPLTVGFRPQLVVVSGLSVGIPLTVGFRPQLVVVSGLLVGIPLTVGFRPSQSLWLSQSLFTNFSFFPMKLRLSRSLFTNFSFTRWNFGYHGAFSRIFLSHDGISAIMKPFMNSSFT
jgi:hypothetical protein